MRVFVSVAIACGLGLTLGWAQPRSDLVVDGVIVAANAADSIALVRRADAKRARALHVGGEYAGYTLVGVTRDGARFSSPAGVVRIALGGGAAPVETDSESGPAEPELLWEYRSFSRTDANARLEKEIPVILSDTEVTPRVVEGEVKGLELLRLPDGTVLSQSGLLPGDVLRSINEEPLQGLDSLWRLLARFANDDELRVVLERHGEVVRIAYNLTN